MVSSARASINLRYLVFFTPGFLQHAAVTSKQKPANYLRILRHALRTILDYLLDGKSPLFYLNVKFKKV